MLLRVGGFFVLVLALLLACSSNTSQPAGGARADVASPPPAPIATSVPATPKTLAFPDDDGAHLALTEWWYYSGHLQSTAGEQYGFMVVVFKRQAQPDRAGFVAHIAITDAQRKVFQFKEAITVAADSLAPGPTFRLQVGSAMVSGGGGIDRLEGSTDSYALQLNLQTVKPPVAQGEKGYISVSPNELSYYYSRTRMQAQGTLSRLGVQTAVTGIAWMDHQWGDFSLEGDSGWDWFGLQLDDGSDLMVSVIRGGDGKSVLTYGTLVDTAGNKTHLDSSRIQVQATGSWTSPATGGRYPMGWHLTTPGAGLDLTVQPVLNEQEMVTWASVGRAYWEGQVSITGKNNDKAVKGQGYVELTGYASPATSGVRP